MKTPTNFAIRVAVVSFEKIMTNLCIKRAERNDDIVAMEYKLGLDSKMEHGHGGHH